MADAVACYVSDDRYMVPTLCSALSCRRHAPRRALDIVVFCVGADEARIGGLDAAFGEDGLRFVAMSPVWRAHYDTSKFRGAYVNDNTLGRFFFDMDVVGSYATILYVDGDTLFEGGVERVAGFDIPEGHLLAAADSLSFARHHDTPLGEETRRYFASIAFPEHETYFNAGVLAGSPETWSGLRSTAFRFFADNPALCHHHDQTALNVVCRDRLVPISTAWNYQSNFVYWGLRPSREIALRHFAGGVKPWEERTWPFLRQSRAYRPCLRRVAAARDDRPPRLNLYKSARHAAKMAVLRAVRRPAMSASRAAIETYERRCVA